MDKYFETIQRVTITCPFKEAQEAIEWAIENSYTITYSGPKRLCIMQASTEVFELIGEKHIRD